MAYFSSRGELGDKANTALVEIKEDSRHHYFHDFYGYTSKYINYKIGMMMGTFSGIITAYEKYDKGFSKAAEAGATQAILTLLNGGGNVELCKYLVTHIKPKWPAIITGTVVPTTTLLTISYFSHKLILGDSTPFDTIKPLIFIVPEMFFFAGLLKYRRQYEKSIKATQNFS